MPARGIRDEMQQMDRPTLMQQRAAPAPQPTPVIPRAAPQLTVSPRPAPMPSAVAPAAPQPAPVAQVQPMATANQGMVSPPAINPVRPVMRV